MIYKKLVIIFKLSTFMSLVFFQALALPTKWGKNSIQNHDYALGSSFILKKYWEYKSGRCEL